MKPILIEAVATGALIALVLLVFPPSSKDANLDNEIVPSANFIEFPAEIDPENPDDSNPGADFTGAGIGFSTADPEFLRKQLEMAGIEVPDGASTAELMELINELLSGGFIAVR